MENGNIKVSFVSLGCSKNLVDTEVMLYRLNEAGYSITADETEADVVIINTCAFIESAKTEAIDNILDIAWLKENRSLRGIVVTGCLAERYRGELLGVGCPRSMRSSVWDQYIGSRRRSRRCSEARSSRASTTRKRSSSDRAAS